MKNRSRCFEIRGTETAGKTSACSQFSCGMWYYITESEQTEDETERQMEGKEKEKR